MKPALYWLALARDAQAASRNDIQMKLIEACAERTRLLALINELEAEAQRLLQQIKKPR